MSERLPATRSADPEGRYRDLLAQRPPLHERMLAYGAITVLVTEDMDAVGFGPHRFKVTIGGNPIEVAAASFDKMTGARVLKTALGTIVIPGAQQRAAGAQVTVGGMVVPGA